MTKHRDVKYSLHYIEVGGEKLIGLGPECDMHGVRAAVSIFGLRNGRMFKVDHFVPGVARVVRLPDDFVRERSASKYNFHRLEVGDEIEVELSHAARNAALIYGKRNGLKISTCKTGDGRLLVKRV